LPVEIKTPFAEYLVRTGRLSRDSLRNLPRRLSEGDLGVGQTALVHELVNSFDLGRILDQDKSGTRFGELALELGQNLESQIQVLETGQQLRACVELIEYLALSGSLSLASGVEALTNFLLTNPLAQELPLPENAG